MCALQLSLIQYCVCAALASDIGKSIGVDPPPLSHDFVPEWHACNRFCVRARVVCTNIMDRERDSFAGIGMWGVGMRRCEASFELEVCAVIIYSRACFHRMSNSDPAHGTERATHFGTCSPVYCVYTYIVTVFMLHQIPTQQKLHGSDRSARLNASAYLIE